MIAYVALGSNLHNPSAQLALAVSLIQAIPGVAVIKTSSVYITAPVGVVDQPDFHNQVISVETGLSPQALLNALLAIEDKMGRVRERHWGERIIDCDLLLYGNLFLESDSLVLPHPRMTTRAFVLYPLAEISPDLVLPTGQHVLALCQTVADQVIEKCEA